MNLVRRVGYSGLRDTIVRHFGNRDSGDRKLIFGDGNHAQGSLELRYVPPWRK